MKLLKSISVLFIFLVLGSGAFAQKVNITLTDPNMASPSETYTVLIQLYDCTSGTPVYVTQWQTPGTWYGSGTTQPFSPFPYTMPKDDQNDYKYHVYVQKNTTPPKYANGWSIGLFDVTGYYSANGIDVSVSF